MTPDLISAGSRPSVSTRPREADKAQRDADRHAQQQQRQQHEHAQRCRSAAWRSCAASCAMRRTSEGDCDSCQCTSDDEHAQRPVGQVQQFAFLVRLPQVSGDPQTAGQQRQEQQRAAARCRALERAAQPAVMRGQRSRCTRACVPASVASSMAAGAGDQHRRLHDLDRPEQRNARLPARRTASASTPMAISSAPPPMATSARCSPGSRGFIAPPACRRRA